MFCAGVILNVSLLELVGRAYFLLGHPAWLLTAIGLCVLFLYFAVLLRFSRFSRIQAKNLGLQMP